MTGEAGLAGAVVISGEWDYAGLGIVRSLGRRGVPVWVLTPSPSLAATSRYAVRTLPWPEGDQEQQLACLLDLAQQLPGGRWAIFPTRDSTAALLSEHHARLSGRFCLTTPPWDIMRWAYDKRLTYRLAAASDVDHPWTCYPRDRAEVLAVDRPFPLILKPAVKASANRFTRAKAWRVEDRAELVARYEQACELVEPELVMVQELIPGAGEAQFSFAALCVDGRPVASAVAQRSRQYPLDFGWTSTHVETVDRPAVEEAARRLLAAMRYTGLVEVEFKYDARDGRHKVLDVNGRVWTWHTLARRAGVDFPYLQWRWLTGEPLDELRAQPGQHWVFLPMDLASGLGEISRGRVSPWAYLRSICRPAELAAFAPDDVVPGLANTPLLALGSLRRRPHSAEPAALAPACIRPAPHA
ncbi:MAG: ATP-grasp domain-containing protein [Chloroflexi bacterium]|nr:ATP-grasp domain-containing protein [Chloroflexota bacterium]